MDCRFLLLIIHTPIPQYTRGYRKALPYRDEDSEGEIVAQGFIRRISLLLTTKVTTKHLIPILQMISYVPFCVNSIIACYVLDSNYRNKLKDNHLEGFCRMHDFILGHSSKHIFNLRCFPKLVGST